MNPTDSLFESVNCLVCNSPEHYKYSNIGQHGLPSHVVICKNCGFSFLNPRWNKKKYDYFYAHEYDNYYRPEIKKRKNDEIRFKSIKTILKRAKEHGISITDPTRIIDIGSGMGDSIIYLKENVFRNAEYYSIEPSEFCSGHLKKNNVTVISNDVDSDWEINYKEKFDLVIMRHVLEHFLSPVEVLKKVATILKPQGVLYLAVPNAFKPTKPLMNHFFRVVHVSYFSPVSLSNTLKLASVKSDVMVEGDSADPHEIYTFAKKNELTTQPSFDKNEFTRQKNIYDKSKQSDPYYRLKRKLLKLINK